MASAIQTENATSRVAPEGLETRKIRIRTSDGVVLYGTTYARETPRAAILLAAGTGIPQYFYEAFANYLVQRGYAVLTFDFRGVGESAPDKMRGFQATKVDWGRYDMSAAFERLCREWPDVPHFFMGHSVGGQLIGLMQNFEKIDAVATYGCGFGYWRGIRGNYKYFVAFLWYLGIPALTSLFDYLPASAIGLGEDLPAGVARDWARWGKRENYFEDEICEAPGFQSLDVPWRAFVAEDDEIATPENAQGLYDLYATEVDVVYLAPQEFGCDDLGHLKFFSRSRREAWHLVPDFFDGLISTV